MNNTTTIIPPSARTPGPRQSLASGLGGHGGASYASANTGGQGSAGAGAGASGKARQLAHLHAQLAQLQAHTADTENLVRMTGVQADFARGLGGWMGGLFMAASKVLEEESMRMQAAATSAAANEDASQADRGTEDEEAA